MCSNEVYKLVTIKVEGALLSVCSNCVQFGNIVEQPRDRTLPRASPDKSNLPPRRSSPKFSKPFKPAPSKKSKQDTELVSDFADVIRNGRMKKKLTQEQLAAKAGLSVPLLKSIESGKMRPTDNAAQKLERELGIELLFTPEAELEYSEKSDAKNTTLGDIAVIKRFDYDK